MIAFKWPWLRLSIANGVLAYRPPAFTRVPLQSPICAYCAGALQARHRVACAVRKRRPPFQRLFLRGRRVWTRSLQPYAVVWPMRTPNGKGISTLYPRLGAESLVRPAARGRQGFLRTYRSTRTRSHGRSRRTPQTSTPEARGAVGGRQRALVCSGPVRSVAPANDPAPSWAPLRVKFPYDRCPSAKASALDARRTRVGTVLLCGSGAPGARPRTGIAGVRRPRAGNVFSVGVALGYRHAANLVY